MWSWVPDEVVMRYVDDELPWFWRIPVRTGVILSSRFRHRVRAWRRLLTLVPCDAGDPARVLRDSLSDRLPIIADFRHGSSDARDPWV